MRVFYGSFDKYKKPKSKFGFFALKAKLEELVGNVVLSNNAKVYYLKHSCMGFVGFLDMLKIVS